MSNALEESPELHRNEGYCLVAVGTLKKSKGYMRLLRIINRLKRENYAIHLYILGIGPLERDMERYIKQNNLQDTVTLLKYQTNPYKYVSKCDLLVCASFAEGFSTAVTEALIMGIPVCTVNVSGMKELLGENNEYGLVTENNEEALFRGIKYLLDDADLLNYYQKQAKIRGKDFVTEATVTAVEKFFLEI